ncbi:MAG TPA: hypothetical protein VKV95_15305 [Terriglobia bacterium]|nr:hypothetical protein [Terriglobia bacterium]
MNCLKISPQRAFLIVTFLIPTLLFENHSLQAKDPPSDACSMLPAAQLAKVLEQTYGSPMKSVAPAAFRNSPTGTDCTYKTEKGSSRTLLFRIYVESSATAAKETFNKLSPYYGPNTAVTGPWDSGYLDGRHAIHVQKDKVRYYLDLSPVGNDKTKTEKQLTGLATWVAGQL